MTNQYFKMNPMFKIFNSTLVILPAPSNLSIFWNFGSLLSLCLISQIISGLLLASAYNPSMDSSFLLISRMMEATDKGWLIRYIHANGASLFFICLYLHIGRGLYYGSFLYKTTWSVGVTILFLTMAAAFLGYVLPMSQMSFWGASVITNLFSEIPYIGPSLVKSIWGAPYVGDPTIMRFFTFHFIIPFIVLALVVVHITLLHQTGSSNPLGVSSNANKLPFHSFFSYKDMMGVTLVMLMFISMVLYTPMLLGDDENFVSANPSVTPHHIQPEWYFLFAYAILRSVPNKLGGVIALALSIFILFIMPFTHLGKKKSLIFYPLNKSLFWAYVASIILLTWIGMRPVEYPYILTGQLLTLFYFAYYLFNPLIMKMWDMINKH
uniref:Cytochrome b n=1 Tax=Gondogeneia antarctica TaxID=1109128 RepID=G8IQP1_GONAN|nr:cytochrome b [Gondogeneia antarctica]